MKDKILMATLAVTIAGVSIWASPSVNAQDRMGSTELVSKIAQKFNLNENDVKAVFDDVHKNRQAQMQARLEEKLTQAVKDGKINETQKKALLAKMKEIHDQKMAGKGGTKADLQAWATANGINLQNLGGIMSHKGFGGRMK